MRLVDKDFQEVTLFDFEFGTDARGMRVPVSLCFEQLVSGRKVRKWMTELGSAPPYDCGPDNLFVCYSAAAEMGCHIALGWPVPSRVLDLYVEYLNHKNGLPRHDSQGNKKKFGLLEALHNFGLTHLAPEEKQGMQELAMAIGAGAAYTEQNKADLLDYNWTDIDALKALLPALLAAVCDQAQRDNDTWKIGWACLRGQYSGGAIAHMDAIGVPIDVSLRDRLERNWDKIKRLIEARLNEKYPGLYDDEGRFSRRVFENILIKNDIAWPRKPSKDGVTPGKLDLDDKRVFRSIAKTNPIVAEIREARYSINQLKLHKLNVGPDGRSHAWLNPFGTDTSRNAPGSNEFIFGESRSMRALIKPVEEWSVAYLDWGQQEIAVAAIQSKDRKMLEAYNTGDFYVGWAQQTGGLPATYDPSNKVQKGVRNNYKTMTLGIGYGQEVFGLQQRSGMKRIEAQYFLSLHKETYHVYWRWVERVVDHAMSTNFIRTDFGWKRRIVAYKNKRTGKEQPNPRSIANFKVQAAGAEMMRLAVIFATEAGIRVCCPIHDAFLIEAPSYRIGEEVERMRECMNRASRIVLDGFTVRVDHQIATWPDRYMDEDGEAHWSLLMECLARCEGKS
jgi:DNA polymerase-1